MPRAARSLASFFAPAVAILPLLTAGCCAHRFERPDGTDPTGVEAVAAARNHSARVESFEMLTRMQFFGDGQRLKGKVEVLGRRGGLLRFEALTPSDDTLARLATDGVRFASHERGSAECLAGPACAENVARLVPIALPPEALYDALLGTLFAFDGEPTVAWDECEGAWRLDRAAGGVTQRAWLRPDDFGVIRVTLLRGETVLLDIAYDDAEVIDGVALPRAIRVTASETGQELELTVSERYVNGVSDDAPFAPTCPTGTRVIELPCRGSIAPRVSPEEAP